MESWKKALDGMVIVRAAIVDKTTFAFVAGWDETIPDNPVRIRLISANLKTGNWGYKEFKTGGMHTSRIAGGRNKNGNRQTLFIPGSGHVVSFEYKDGPNSLEGRMPMASTRAAGHFGDHFYAAGAGRGFMRRMGPGDWEVFSHTPYTDPASDPGPFIAMDGYGENDIYLWAAGRYKTVDRNSRGSLQHWDGANFTEIPLPKDIFEGVPWGPFGAIDICCAPDGRVFLSGVNGELLMGSRDGFVVLLKQEERSWPRTNLAWFKGVLYGATQGGLYTFDFDQNRWAPAPFVEDENAPVNFPYIDANDDVMLLAGGFGASIYDGERWTRIAGEVSALDMTRLRLMERQVEDVRDLRDILRDEAQQQ